MKLKSLLEGIEILETNAPMDMEITGVSHSSQTVTPGVLFAAIPGYTVDGHRFIPDAVNKGAAVVLCQRDMPADAPWVRVEDTAQLWRSWVPTGTAIRQAAWRSSA